jgi:putative nucleotidyltransferase with HDIG domain
LDHNETQSQSVRKTKASPRAPLDVMGRMIGVVRIPSVREGLLVLICFSLLITLLQINLFPRALELKAGQISKIEVIATKDVVDLEATKLARDEAEFRAIEIARQDPDYYKIDTSVSSDVSYKLNQVFQLIDQERKQFARESKFKDSAGEATLLSRIQKFLPQGLNRQLLRGLVRLPEGDYREVKEKSHQILVEVLANQKIDERDLEKVRLSLSLLLEERQIRTELRPVLGEVLAAALRPNLALNNVKIARLKERVRREVPDVIRHKNEVLIAKNQVVTENDLQMLKELHLIADESNRIRVFLSLSFFILLLVVLGLVYILQFQPWLFKQERLLYLLLILLLLVVGMIKVFSLADTQSLPYLAPVSFATMLISIMVNPQLALSMAAILSLFGGIIVDFSLALTVFYFVSGMVSVLALKDFQRQRDLVRSGSLLMIVNAATAIALNLLFRTAFKFDAVLFAIANGFLSSVLAIGSIPFVEHLFKLTSPIRLLELSNPGHPLLRRLQIEAPGTYHHSIMVGNLAEAAAEGIGADALWVRVGSYYHDIGKIKRPYFFVENQMGQDNPHEKLNPTLSTLIITYHVKEGAEIAREHGLPDKLIAIIEQHHGTDLVRYFYKRATENVQGERENLIEEDFRYEGPKPRSKEAALVMLADSVEAAVRSLAKPTPAKVEALIQKIIRERLDDGQFDECDLTLRDLNSVKNSFLKVLGGMFHNRIEYPETVLKEIERKKTIADTGKQYSG